MVWKARIWICNFPLLDTIPTYMRSTAMHLFPDKVGCIDHSADSQWVDGIKF